MSIYCIIRISYEGNYKEFISELIRRIKATTTGGRNVQWVGSLNR